MAQNISDTVFTNMVDQMTAVTKGCVAAYTTNEEEDLFQIMVREQNPDDLATGVTYAETIDDSLAAGSSYSSLWSSILSWLTSRASASGYASLDLFLAGRHLRIPHTFNQYIYYPIYGANVTDSYIFPDKYWNGAAWTTYGLGTFDHGGAFVDGDTLPTAIGGVWGQITSTVAGPGAWTVEVDVTYSDATTATETIALAAGTNTYDIGGMPLIACGAAAGTVSLAGTAKVYINTPVGYVKGQEVLIWTGQYHALLTADYEGASVAAATCYISPADAGCFKAGDSLTIDHEAAAAAGAANVIQSINYETGLITFAANLPATDYLMSANAHIYKTAPDAVTSYVSSGNCEVHTVKEVVSVAAGYVELTTNLQHTYVGTDCKCIRLISGITDITTNAGGAGGDTSATYAVAERNIAQNSII